MEDKLKLGRKRILSIVVAILLIVTAAVAIGWFAGEALLGILSPEAGEPSGGIGQATGEEAEAFDTEPGPDATTAGGQAGESGAGIVLPEIAGSPGGGDEADSSSPFASPPWEENLSIKPLEEELEETPVDATSAEDEATEQTAFSTGSPIQTESATALTEGPAVPPQASNPAEGSTGAEAAGSVAGPVKQALYRVRVGPFASRQDTDAEAKRLSEAGYPTMVGNDGKFYIQIGAFSVWANAEALMKKAQASGFTAYISD